MTNLNAKSKQAIVDEAQKRFHVCEQWEGPSRINFKADYKFANGDPYNNYQWPQSILSERNGKPSMTVNRVRQYNLQIINGNRLNKTDVKIRPVGGEASFQSAEILNGIIKHIEYISDAQQAYDTASEGQVYAGIGYWRLVTDYASETTFDQEIYIRRIADPLMVYLDPHIQMFDGSDAKYAFIFDERDKSEFYDEYPKYRDQIGNTPLSGDPGGNDHARGWLDEDRIRVCEYYRKTTVDDVLHRLNDGTTVTESEAANIPGMDKVIAKHSTHSRPISRSKIMWYLIAGGTIIDETEWAGKYIPIVRVIGEETVIDNTLDRKGHTRALISPQEAYNYYTSSAIEGVALQTKTPWLTSAEAIEGHEEDWAESNIQNKSVLIHNAIADKGPVPTPTRIQPPVMASAYMDGMKVAQNEMGMASGQTESSMGGQTNERSGKAINERQRTGQTATYHYIDHLSSALRFTGKILIDLIPKIYDTPRILKILAQDGTPMTVQVDPKAPAAHQPSDPIDAEGLDQDHVTAIFNPNVGQYDVIADNGPNYATRRLEEFNDLTQIITQNESMAPYLLDRWAANSDFPDANVLAARFRNMLPANAKGQAPSPELEQAQKQMQLLQQELAKTTKELEAAKAKFTVSELQKEIDFYKAETDRMAVVGKIDPHVLKPIIREQASQIIGQPINGVISAHIHEDDTMLQMIDQQNQQALAGQQPQGQPQQPNPQQGQ